ncbi:hypothetical protein L0F63_002705 [Massospora cicadina]|nr:hypothetical protein L0F63_002705 [Massospora cicadina]
MSPVAQYLQGSPKSEEAPVQKEDKFVAFKPQKASLEELLKICQANRSLDIVYQGFKANHNIHALCSLYALGGLAGAALHPLIHMGYSVEFELPVAAAEGLAYACSNYSAVGEAINKVSDEGSLGASFFEIITNSSFEKSKYETSERKRSLLETKIWGFVGKYGEELVKMCSAWGCNRENLLERSDDLAISTVKIFDGSYRQKTLDFFLLHALTGNHGVRTLMTILETKDQIRLLNLNFMALAILFGVQGVPSIHSESSFEVIYDGISVTWEELAKRASESNDSHVLKAVRNLRQLELTYGQMDGMFHRPAVRCVQDVLVNGWCFEGIGFLPKD